MEVLFDVLFNNITSNQAPGLNVHEKSVLLTKAQDEITKNYFNAKGNKLSEGYDDSQKRQIDFSSITKVYSVLDPSSFGPALYDGRSNSKSVVLPSGVWMIVNERVTVRHGDSTSGLVVVPISFADYDRLMSKPFKRPLKYQAWRLLNNDGSNKSDLIIGSGDTLVSYALRYVCKPHPIILGDLDGLSIDGYTYGGDVTPSSGDVPFKVYGDKCCELDPILHEEIVQRAVELAKVAWTSTGQDNAQLVMQAGQRSE